MQFGSESGHKVKAVAAIAQFVLASASPRRAALLRQIGLEFTVDAVPIDETMVANGSPSEIVVDLAKRKAQACVEKLETVDGGCSLPVLAADTLVFLAQEPLGKPQDRLDAIRMLQLLSNGAHEVCTGVAVATGSCLRTCVASATVHMRTIHPHEMESYCNSQEPYDKAGAYGLQGIGSVFVERIQGQPSTVMGLPLRETEQLLQKSGVDTWKYRH